MFYYMQIKRIIRKQKIHLMSNQMLNSVVIQMPNACDIEKTCNYWMGLFDPYFMAISSIRFHFGNFYHKQKLLTVYRCATYLAILNIFEALSL